MNGTLITEDDNKKFIGSDRCGKGKVIISLSKYLNVDAEPVDLSNYVQFEDLPEPQDLTPYLLTKNLPEPQDLTPYLLNTNLPPKHDLSPYQTI